MTDLGNPAPDGASNGGPDGASDGASNGAPDRSTGRTLAVVLVALALVVAAVGAGAWVLLRDGGDAPAARKIVFPKTWDERIKPLADIAAKERGLDFDHPVAVRFLTPAKFEKTVTSDKEDLGAEDKKELAHVTSLLRALGLIAGDVDLFDAVQESTSGGTLAYYSFEDKRITVRGTELTPAVKGTLVHELTHVLQDQHFNISERTKKLHDSDEQDSESSVLDAVVEGDAERVATRYRESLSKAEQKAYDAGDEAQTKEATDRLKNVPKFVTTMMGAPYALGEAMVQAVAEDGGNKAVDKLFSNTPKHETALLDPFTVLDGNTGEEKVPTPKPAKGEKKFDTGELGTLTWYLMLAERLPLPQALTVADGWGGDSYLGFERGKQDCTRVNYVGHSAADTTAMRSALTSWIAAVPGSTATVEEEDGHLVFESCDPGASARITKDASEDAVVLAVTRAYIGIQLLGSGLDAKTAGCFSGKLAQTYTAAQLSDPKFGAKDPAVQRKIQQLAAGCRA